MDEAPTPCSSNQDTAYPPVHNPGVVKRFANGYITVIGHDHQQESFSCSQEVEEEKLGHAGAIGDGLRMCKKVSQHFGWSHRTVADVQECQIGQERIHGWSQLGISSNCENDKDIAWQNDHIKEQEEEEENHLNFMVLGQSQQNKLCNYCIVLMLHFYSAKC